MEGGSKRNHLSVAMVEIQGTLASLEGIIVGTDWRPNSVIWGTQ